MQLQLVDSYIGNQYSWECLGYLYLTCKLQKTFCHEYTLKYDHELVFITLWHYQGLTSSEPLLSRQHVPEANTVQPDKSSYQKYENDLNESARLHDYRIDIANLKLLQDGQWYSTFWCIAVLQFFLLLELQLFLMLMDWSYEYHIL